MTERVVKDSAGRAWTCVAVEEASAHAGGSEGRDIVLQCSTPSVESPVKLTVGWQWVSMSENGLGRKISELSPAPRH